MEFGVAGGYSGDYLPLWMSTAEESFRDWEIDP